MLWLWLITIHRTLASWQEHKLVISHFLLNEEMYVHLGLQMSMAKEKIDMSIFALPPAFDRSRELLSAYLHSLHNAEAVKRTA